MEHQNEAIKQIEKLEDLIVIEESKIVEIQKQKTDILERYLNE